MKAKASPVANGTCRLGVNAIINGAWITMGDRIPVKDLPRAFHQYIIEDEDQEQVDEGVNLAYRLNETYSIDAEGNRHLARQVKELRIIASEERAVQEAIEAENENPVIADAMRQVQQANDAYVGQQIAEFQARANRDDASKESLIEEQDLSTLDPEGFTIDSSNTENHKQPLSALSVPIVESKPQPKRMRKRYVRRGAVYRLAKDVRVKISEPVFIRKDGEFIQCGIINKNGKAPQIFMED